MIEIVEIIASPIASVYKSNGRIYGFFPHENITKTMGSTIKPYPQMFSRYFPGIHPSVVRHSAGGSQHVADPDCQHGWSTSSGGSRLSAAGSYHVIYYAH